MCGRREISERHGEAGMLLMELAVSLPVFVLLLSFLAFAVAWSWRSYQREIADAELRLSTTIRPFAANGGIVKKFRKKNPS